MEMRKAPWTLRRDAFSDELILAARELILKTKTNMTPRPTSPWMMLAMPPPTINRRCPRIPGNPVSHLRPEPPARGRAVAVITPMTIRSITSLEISGSASKTRDGSGAGPRTSWTITGIAGRHQSDRNRNGSGGPITLSTRRV